MWINGRAELPHGSGVSAVYELSGPTFEIQPEADHYILAPMDEGGFATALYEGKATPERLRQFLHRCRLAVGGVTEDLEYLLVREEEPILPVLERLVSEALPPLPYDEQIESFLLEDAAIPVLPEVYRKMLAGPEFFGTASVCEACGEPEDLSAFLWTTRADQAVRVNLVIQNQGGVWHCWLAPFAVSLPTPNMQTF